MDRPLPESDPLAAAKAVFRWYLAGSASWFSGVGIGMVLFPYLVTVRLGEPATNVGIAQMALTAPSLLLMLYGGALADRNDPRGLLVRYHLAATVVPVLLAAVILGGELSFPVLVTFAVLQGSISALAIPAREALLMRMVPPGMALQQAVSSTVVTQFGSQVAGMASAGLAALTGPAVILMLQGALYLAGTQASLKLPERGAAPAPAGSRLDAIREGLASIAASPTLLPVIVATLSIGFFYVGSFMVILPIFIRDVYAGDAATFALVNVCFWSGTIATSTILGRMAPIRHQGRAMVIALCMGAAVLVTMHFSWPLAVFVVLCALWGSGAGVVVTMGRTILQQQAPDAQRGRILAVYNLAFNGGAPLGALTLGFVVQAVGPHTAVFVPAFGMLSVLAVLAATTRVLAITAPERH